MQAEHLCDFTSGIDDVRRSRDMSTINTAGFDNHYKNFVFGCICCILTSLAIQQHVTDLQNL